MDDLPFQAKQGRSLTEYLPIYYFSGKQESVNKYTMSGNIIHVIIYWVTRLPNSAQTVQNISDKSHVYSELFNQAFHLQTGT